MSGIPKRFRNGSMTELFRYPTAAAMLMEYETQEQKPMMRLLGLGLFFVNAVMQTVDPVLDMTICSVNGFQWPLTKDTPIIRMGKRTFIFGLPGLLYALQFPAVCGPTLIGCLERVFMRFGYYHDFADFSTTAGLRYPCPDNDPSVWKTVRPLVEPKAHEILSQFGHQPGLSRFCVSDHNSCFTRATRLSATTKTIMEALTSGALKPAYITIEGAMNDLHSNAASPSISVFTCLVDAVEASCLISHGLVSPVLNTQPPLQTYPSPGFRVWRLNEVGLVTFMKGLDSAAEREAEIVSARTAEEDDDDKEEEEAFASAVDKGKGKQVVKP